MKLGCRMCGARLDSEAFRTHLDALVGKTARHLAAHATPDRAAIQSPVRAAGARLAGFWAR